MIKSKLLMNGAPAVAPASGSSFVYQEALNANVVAVYAQVISDQRGLDLTIHEVEDTDRRIMEMHHLVGHNGNNWGSGEPGAAMPIGFDKTGATIPVGSTSWQAEKFWTFPEPVPIRTLGVELAANGANYNIYLLVWIQADATTGEIIANAF